MPSTYCVCSLRRDVFAIAKFLSVLTIYYAHKQCQIITLRIAALAMLIVCSVLRSCSGKG